MIIFSSFYSIFSSCEPELWLIRIVVQGLQWFPAQWKINELAARDIHHPHKKNHPHSRQSSWKSLHHRHHQSIMMTKMTTKMRTKMMAKMMAKMLTMVMTKMMAMTENADIRQCWCSASEARTYFGLPWFFWKGKFGQIQSDPPFHKTLPEAQQTQKSTPWFALVANLATRWRHLH